MSTASDSHSPSVVLYCVILKMLQLVLTTQCSVQQAAILMPLSGAPDDLFPQISVPCYIDPAGKWSGNSCWLVDLLRTDFLALMLLHFYCIFRVFLAPKNIAGNNN